MSNAMSTGPGPFLISSETETDTNGASSTIETWEGTETECRIKRLVLLGAGATRIRLAPKGDGAWQVRGSFPFDTEGQNRSYVDVMELEVNVIQQRWENSPVYRSYFSDYNPVTRHSDKAVATIAVIRDVKNKYHSGRPDVQTSGTNQGKYLWLNTPYNTKEEALGAEYLTRINAIAGLSDPEKGHAFHLHNQVAFMGLTSFIEYNHVFRRRVTAGTPAAITANQTGGGKIWTSAEVISWEGIPSNGWFQLPPDVQWHKDKPRVLASYGQKTEISYNYTEVTTASRYMYEAHGAAVLIPVT